MQYDVSSPHEYLNSLPEDWRKETLEELRALILEQSSELEECINYKMLCYRLSGNAVLHLNAQKGYVSLYVGNIEKIDPEKAMLDGLNIGKGCIRFSKSKRVGATRIDEFIAKSVELAEMGMDLDC